MELLFDESPSSLAAALVMRYAAPPAAAAARPSGLAASFVGPIAKRFLGPRVQHLPLLLLLQEDKGESVVLEEPAAILRCCCAAAASSSCCSSSSSSPAAAPEKASAERQALPPTSSSDSSSSKAAAAAPSPAETAAATLLLGGSDAVQQAQVMQWVAFCCEQQFCLQGASSLQQLQQHLAMRTFLVAAHLTLADLAVYAACHRWMALASEKERLLHCNVTRWFDHVQHLPGVAGAVEQLPILDVLPSPRMQPPPAAASGRLARNSSSGSSSSEGMLPNGVGGSSEEQASRKKKQQQPQQQQQTLLVNGVAAAEEAKRGRGGGRSSKGGKANEAAAKAAGGEAAAKPKEHSSQADRPIEDVTRLRVVVGQIKKVWRHPDADQLFCEEVDVGEEQPRLIASGLVPYTTAEELQGKKVLVLANMKPRPLRGFTSHGMLLCASSPDHSRCETLRPPSDTPVGEAVTWEGAEGGGPPDTPHMNTKAGKYPFAAVQPHFRTDENCVAYYKGHRFLTSRGPVTCDTIAGGTIS